MSEWVPVFLVAAVLLDAAADAVAARVRTWAFPERVARRESMRITRGCLP